MNSKKVIDWHQTSCYITAIKFTSCGERLYVGLVNGDVVIYDSTQSKLKLLKVVECKNKRGRFSNGRKVTSIDFLNINVAMVTTNDSRIRFIDAKVRAFSMIMSRVESGCTRSKGIRTRAFMSRLASQRINNMSYAAQKMVIYIFGARSKAQSSKKSKKVSLGSSSWLTSLALVSILPLSAKASQ